MRTLVSGLPGNVDVGGPVLRGAGTARGTPAPASPLAPVGTYGAAIQPRRRTRSQLWLPLVSTSIIRRQ